VNNERLIVTPYSRAAFGAAILILLAGCGSDKVEEQQKHIVQLESRMAALESKLAKLEVAERQVVSIAATRQDGAFFGTEPQLQLQAQAPAQDPAPFYVKPPSDVHFY
jgi:hypothetical protein